MQPEEYVKLNNLLKELSLDIYTVESTLAVLLADKYNFNRSIIDLLEKKVIKLYRKRREVGYLFREIIKVLDVPSTM